MNSFLITLFCFIMISSCFNNINLGSKKELCMLDENPPVTYLKGPVKKVGLRSSFVALPGSVLSDFRG